MPATQKGTTQAANETAAFKEALEIIISTPLPKAFECRRCLAEFSFNSQLHRHIRESHSIGTASSTIHSAFKNSASPHTTRPATPPPTYRAISPPPPAYKAYLTIQDLYIRYAPLKSIHSAPKLAPNTASYLTVQDLYKRFKKLSKKPYYGTANRTTAFGPKLPSWSAPLVSKASIKSIGKNTGKAVHSTQIKLSNIKPAFDSKISSINSF